MPAVGIRNVHLSMRSSPVSCNDIVGRGRVWCKHTWKPLAAIPTETTLGQTGTAVSSHSTPRRNPSLITTAAPQPIHTELWRLGQGSVGPPLFFETWQQK